MRCVVNLNFGDRRIGEIVDVDPDEWAGYLDAGYLFEVDDQGNRLVPIVVRMPGSLTLNPSDVTIHSASSGTFTIEPEALDASGEVWERYAPDPPE